MGWEEGTTKYRKCYPLENFLEEIAVLEEEVGQGIEVLQNPLVKKQEECSCMEEVGDRMDNPSWCWKG